MDPDTVAIAAYSPKQIQDFQKILQFIRKKSWFWNFPTSLIEISNLRQSFYPPVTDIKITDDHQVLFISDDSKNIGSPDAKGKNTLIAYFNEANKIKFKCNCTCASNSKNDKLCDHGLTQLMWIANHLTDERARIFINAESETILSDNLNSSTQQSNTSAKSTTLLDLLNSPTTATNLIQYDVGLPASMTPLTAEIHINALPFTLKRDTFGMAQKGYFTLNQTKYCRIISVFFRYQGCDQLISSHDKSPAFKVIVTKDEKNIQIQYTCMRRKQEEQKILQQIFKFPFLRIENWVSADVHEVYDSNHFGIFKKDSTFLWYQFIHQFAPTLKDITLIRNDLDFEPISEIPEHNNWFKEITEIQPDQLQFDLGLEINGKRQSLIKALATAIQTPESICQITKQDGSQWILFHPDTDHDDQLILLPAEKFNSLLKTLMDLSSSISLTPNKPLILNRQQAIHNFIDDEVTLKTSNTFIQQYQKFKNFSHLEIPKAPLSLQASLRPYQLEGLAWLLFLQEYQLNGILADDMGLGKTLQTIAFILHLQENHQLQRPILIVAPKSVISNWQNELAKFAPSLTSLIHAGNQRTHDIQTLSQYSIVITSYPVLNRDQAIFTQQHWQCIVLDEAQTIKNPSSQMAKTCYSLKADTRLCLTGTPLENHLGELWSLFHFLMPKLLGKLNKFKEDFQRPIEKNQDPAAHRALRRKLHALILRRTKNEVATELPPKTEIIHKIQLADEQHEVYEAVRALMEKEIRSALASKSVERNQILILDAMMKLRQICCHPQLLKLKKIKSCSQSAKLDFLFDELLIELIEEGHQILLFSQFTSMLAIIEKKIKELKISYAKITGATEDRQKQVDLFQSGSARLFLISLKAGGTGLNLTAADIVIHYDPWWNPAAESQATDRAYRIGQNKPVFVHKLICENSIEEKVLTLQNKKNQLLQQVLSGQSSKTKLSQEDVLSIFS
jgi:SNF2 family DNA or RNA helicase